MNNKKVKNAANWAQIIQLLLQVLTILMPAVAFIALEENNSALSVNFKGIKIDSSYQIIMLISAILLYTQYCRNRYDELDENVRPKLFIDYISIHALSKRQTILIPYIILFGLMGIIHPGFLFVPAGILLLFFFRIHLSIIEKDSFVTKWKEDDSYRNGWVNRIFDTIREKKREIETNDFLDKGYSKNDYLEINYALIQFYKEFEFDYFMKIREVEGIFSGRETVYLEWIGKRKIK